MSQEPKNNEEGFMYKLASFIVDKRNLIFLIVAIGLVFSAFSRNWVQVENQLSAYLPKDSETYKGLHLMEDEFITFGTAKIMLVNVTYDEAQAVSERLEAVDGVQSVTFDDTKEHYTNASALYNITFDYSETDDMCETVMERVEDELSGYDMYVSATFGDRRDRHHRSYRRGVRADPDLADLCGGAGAAHYVHCSGAFEHGHELPARHDLVRVKLRHDCAAISAVCGLCDHFLQPL